MSSQMNKEDSIYRRGVGICLLNQRGKIFVGARIDFDKDVWQMPQGGIDENENPREAALRELKEETSIISIQEKLFPERWFYYDIPQELRLRDFWRNSSYKGQKQRWLLAEFIGDESEINLATKHPEFKKWRWMLPEEFLEITEGFKKDLYRDVLESFHLVSSQKK